MLQVGLHVSFSKALSGQGAAAVVCGNLNSSGQGTPNHYDLYDFTQSYGVINASCLRKFSVPSSSQCGEKKAQSLDHSVWFYKPNTGPEKARTSYKSCIYFTDRLKASWFHCVDRLQAIWNSQKINITAVGLVFLSKSQKMSNDFRKDRERLLGNHCFQDATEANNILFRKKHLVSKTKKQNFYVTFLMR